MNEILTITQIVQVKGNGYIFFYNYGVPFDDIYEALQTLEKDNRAKQAQMIEEAEKKKLEQEMTNAVAEAEAQ